MATAVDRLYEEATGIIQALAQADHLSLQIAAGDQSRKALLLAAASYFENRICEFVVEFVRERSNGSLLVEHFVRNKAISRQYHTWFNWDANNANQFFGLFGGAYKTAMIARVSGSGQMQESIRAFLAVGCERNKLVHQDYATFAMEKTLDEIYDLYKKALLFIETLPRSLREIDRSTFTESASETLSID